MRNLRQPWRRIILAILFLVVGSATAFIYARPFDTTQSPATLAQILNGPLHSPATNPLSTRSNLPASGLPISVRATGNLASVSQAALSFQAAGRIKEIKVKQGDRVKVGTVLASLDTSGLDAQVTSAAANLAKVKAGPSADDLTVAKGNVERAKAALDQAQAAYDRIGGATNPASGASSQSLTLQQAYISYQQAVAQFNLVLNHPTEPELTAAQATLETAKVAAANARLIAPFDGTILWMGIRIGESVGVGTGVMVIADTSRMQLQLSVDEISAASVQVGQAATVTLDALPGKPVKGRVSSIALLGISSGSLVTIPVTIDLDVANMPLFPGLTGTADIQGVTP